MAYKIEYPHYRKKAKKKIFKKLLLVTGLVFLLILTHGLWWEELQTIRSYLIPDETALRTFLDDLQSGDSFSEAVEAFCQDLFHGQ